MDSHRLQFEQLRNSLLITATKREFMEREIWRIGKVMKATGLSGISAGTGTKSWILSISDSGKQLGAHDVGT